MTANTHTLGKRSGLSLLYGHLSLSLSFVKNPGVSCKIATGFSLLSLVAERRRDMTHSIAIRLPLCLPSPFPLVLNASYNSNQLPRTANGFRARAAERPRDRESFSFSARALTRFSKKSRETPPRADDDRAERKARVPQNPENVPLSSFGVSPSSRFIPTVGEDPRGV